METVSVDLFKRLVCERRGENRTLSSKSLEQGLINDSLKASPWPICVNKVLLEHRPFCSSKY